MRRLIFLVAMLAPAAHADPLQDFEAIVAACRAAVTAQTTEIREITLAGQKQWAKIVLAPDGKVAYDVRKTDSLVSPLVGTIEFTTLKASDVAATVDKAKGLAVTFEGSRVSRIGTTIRFAHQAGAWKAVGGTQAYEHRRSAAEPFFGKMDITVDQAALDSPLNEAGRCVLAQRGS